MALPATEFLRLHGQQLEAVGFPPSLIPALQQKLAEDVFDAGGTFQVSRGRVCAAEARGIDVDRIESIV